MVWRQTCGIFLLWSTRKVQTYLSVHLPIVYNGTLGHSGSLTLRHFVRLRTAFVDRRRPLWCHSGSRANVYSHNDEMTADKHGKWRVSQWVSRTCYQSAPNESVHTAMSHSKRTSFCPLTFDLHYGGKAIFSRSCEMFDDDIFFCGKVLCITCHIIGIILTANAVFVMCKLILWVYFSFYHLCRSA